VNFQVEERYVLLERIDDYSCFPDSWRWPRGMRAGVVLTVRVTTPSIIDRNYTTDCRQLSSAKGMKE
jgi:hypothetical protein